MVQDNDCILELLKKSKEVDATWALFSKVLSQNSVVFDKRLNDKDLFKSIYSHVCANSVDYDNFGTVMMPMADNLNHNSIDIKYEVIYPKLHVKGIKDGKKLPSTASRDYF